MTEVIRAESVSLGFRRWKQDRPASIQEFIQRGLRRTRSKEMSWALRDVSFSVSSGKSLGVVGPNGAGKSTLLRIIGGVLTPDRGKITVTGRLGAILELGSGFRTDLTGRENIFINGIIAGLTHHEVQRRFDEIVAFSELEEFLDAPLRTYSNGMRMRLGFSIAVHVDAQLLLIDEILAVGDLAFRKKCIARLEHFCSSGCTTVLVAHDPQIMLRLCDEGLWIDRGQVHSFGPAGAVIEEYTAEQKRPKSPSKTHGGP